MHHLLWRPQGSNFRAGKSSKKVTCKCSKRDTERRCARSYAMKKLPRVLSYGMHPTERSAFSTTFHLLADFLTEINVEAIG